MNTRDEFKKFMDEMKCKKSYECTKKENGDGRMNIMLDKNAFMPERAHDLDAGYDLRTPIDFKIYCRDFKTIDTGVHVEISKGYVGFLKSKSGLNIKDGINGEGVIDAGYTGSIKVKLYNNSFSLKRFKKGDKIIQLVILPIFTPGLQKVDKFVETERGDNGFGSTGR